MGTFMSRERMSPARRAGTPRARRILAAVSAAAAFLTLVPPAPAQEQIAIKGGRIISVANPPIERGVILIREGRIQAVGKDLAIPSDYKVLDATGKVIMPGFIEAHSSRGMDQANERNNNVPFLSVMDAIDPGQEYFEDCRRNGVTTVAVAPGDDTMIGGQTAVIKTAGVIVDQMVVKRNAGVKISLKPGTGRSRMGQLASLRKELDAARDAIQDEYDKPKVAGVGNDDDGDDNGGGQSVDDPLQQQPPVDGAGAPEATADGPVRREALIRLLKGELAAYIYCELAMDVPQAIKLTKEYNLKTTLVLGHLCYKAAKQVAASKLPVVVDSTLVFWETDPRTGEDHKIVVPKIYREAGAPLTFQVTGIAGGSLFRAPDLPPTLGSNFLWYQAATAVKYGLPINEALESITLRPAKLLGIEKLAGSIEPGKDADLVIMTGDPLRVSTWVDTTLIRGKVVYERAKDRKLQQLLPTSIQSVTSR
jgi:imidazolonepropionase-like amidohydrolase